MKRITLLALAIAATMAAAAGTPAQAQNYPWCEYLGGGMGGGGGRNCGFISFEQCMQSAFGNGSDCRPNTQYVPPPGEHPYPGTAPAAARHPAKKTHKSS
jgi:hypothetical protein